MSAIKIILTPHEAAVIEVALKLYAMGTLGNEKAVCIDVAAQIENEMNREDSRAATFGTQTEAEAAAEMQAVLRGKHPGAYA